MLGMDSSSSSSSSPPTPTPTDAAKTASVEAKTIDNISTLAYDNFLLSIKSETTKERYVYCLGRYLKFLGYPNSDRIEVLLEQHMSNIRIRIKTCSKVRNIF